MNLKLIPPCEEYKQQIVAMLEAWFRAEAPQDITPWAITRSDYHDFAQYCRDMQILEGQDGLVPDVTLFCLDQDRNVCVGAVNIRKWLNDRLLRSGGHIGDGLCPLERGKGYGTPMVGLALQECRKLGITRVLMVCEKDNIPSAKTIQHNGGILENEIWDDGCLLQRYWIDLADDVL